LYDLNIKKDLLENIVNQATGEPIDFNSMAKKRYIFQKIFYVS